MARTPDVETETTAADLAWRVIIVMAVVVVLLGAVVFLGWRTVAGVKEDLPKNRAVACSGLMHDGVPVEDLPPVCLEVPVRQYLKGP